MATKPPLGSGQRFSALTQQLASKGAKDPKALAAYIGRKKLGKKRFQSLAVKGRNEERGETRADSEKGGG